MRRRISFRYPRWIERRGVIEPTRYCRVRGYYADLSRIPNELERVIQKVASLPDPCIDEFVNLLRDILERDHPTFGEWGRLERARRRAHIAIAEAQEFKTKKRVWARRNGRDPDGLFWFTLADVDPINAVKLPLGRRQRR